MSFGEHSSHRIRGIYHEHKLSFLIDQCFSVFKVDLEIALSFEFVLNCLPIHGWAKVLEEGIAYLRN